MKKESKCLSKGPKHNNFSIDKNINLIASTDKMKTAPVTIVIPHRNRPYIIQKNLKSLQTLKTFPQKVIIVDDSFQSHYIKKNLDILLIDVSINIQDYQLLPSGRLREPIKQINRADIIFLYIFPNDILKCDAYLYPCSKSNILFILILLPPPLYPIIILFNFNILDIVIS